MPKIPKTKEQPARYMTPSTRIMAPQETFINRAMKQPNVQVRLPMRVEPSKVEPKGWGDNAIIVALANL